MNKEEKKIAIIIPITVAIIGGIFAVAPAILENMFPPDPDLEAIITQIDGPHYVGSSITFSAKESNPHDKISKYDWNFGDDSTIRDGELVHHTFDKEGDYIVILTVHADDGRIDEGYLSITIIPDTNIEREIASNLSDMLYKKIKTDVSVIKENLISIEMQTPFDPAVLDDNKFFTCYEDVPNDKCPILFKIWRETGSAYAFIFYYPNEIVHTSKKTSEDCIIEISTLNSVITNNVENKWNDRQWCNSEESVLMTDLYHPRNKPMINVNSLLIEYRDSNKDRLGLINAYNLEELIANNMKEYSLSSFNVILLDEKNCVAGAVSKTKGDITIHMEKGIWQLSNENTDGTFHIFHDVYSESNCNQNYAEYDLDDLEYVEVTVGDISEGRISKLDEKYAVFEMTPVTDKDLDMTNVDIFQDWHLLVSIP